MADPAAEWALGFYKVYLKLMGLMLILMVVSMVPFVGSSVRVAAAIFGGLPRPIFMIFMVQLCIRPYLAIRMQNLVWGHRPSPSAVPQPPGVEGLPAGLLGLWVADPHHDGPLLARGPQSH